MQERSVRFILEKNKSKGRFYGSIVPNAIVELDSIVRGAAPWLHPDDASEIVMRAGQEVRSQLRAGNIVRVPEFLTVEPVIEGIFTGEADAFDPRRHSLGARVSLDRTFPRLDGGVRFRRVSLERRD